MLSLVKGSTMFINLLGGFVCSIFVVHSMGDSALVWLIFEL